jgi:hypothetical protein
MQSWRAVPGGPSVFPSWLGHTVLPFVGELLNLDPDSRVDAFASGLHQLVESPAKNMGPNHFSFNRNAVLLCLPVLFDCLRNTVSAVKKRHVLQLLVQLFVDSPSSDDVRSNHFFSSHVFSCQLTRLL